MGRSLVNQLMFIWSLKSHVKCFEHFPYKKAGKTLIKKIIIRMNMNYNKISDQRNRTKIIEKVNPL